MTPYFPFAAEGGADFLAGFAGRDLPNDPLNIFPFLVFLSPLPMMKFFLSPIGRFGKKAPYLHFHAR
jgi:hypothetical protein